MVIVRGQSTATIASKAIVVAIASIYTINSVDSY